MRESGTASLETREQLRAQARLSCAVRRRARADRTSWRARALVWLIATALSAGSSTAAVVPDTLSPALHRPIASLLADAGEGDEVIVRGVVREKTGPSTYIVEDESGNAHVRIPDALLTGGIALAAGTAVEIHGRVKPTPTRGFRIEAQRATVLRASNVPLGAGDVRIR